MTEAVDARDARLAELMGELLAPPDPAQAHAVRMARTRELVAEMDALLPGALDRLQSAHAGLQLRRLRREGGLTN